MSEHRTTHPSIRTAAAQWLQVGMEGIVFLLVAFAPWAFGAVDPFYEYVLFAGIALLAGLWAARAACLGQFVWFTCPVALSIATIFLVGILQLVPLPGPLVGLISPTARELQTSLMPQIPEIIVAGDLPSAVGPSTISLNPHATRVELFRWLALLVLFAVVRINVATVDSFRRLAWLCFANGVGLAIFAFIQFFGSPARSVYGFPTGGEVYGPFICRNHYSFYLNVCIGLGIGLLLISSKSEGDKRAKRTHKANALVEQDADDGTSLSILGILHSPLQLWLSVGVAVMIASVIGSMSRGGVASLAIGGIATLALRGVGSRRKNQWELLIVPALLVGGILAWLGISPLESRLNTLWKGGLFGDGRVQMWQNVLPLTLRFPFLGSGFGTMPIIEPIFRQFDYSGYQGTVVVDHVHNDYLEALVEGGLPRFLATIAAVYFLIRYGRKAMVRHEIRTPGRLALGGLIGILAVTIHSFVDFGMNTPAVACLVTVVAAYICTMARSDPSRVPTSESKYALTLELGGWGGLAGGAVLCSIGTLLILQGATRANEQRRRVQAHKALHKYQPPNPAQAIEFLKQAVQSNPDDPELRVELGQLYLQSAVGDSSGWASQHGVASADEHTALGVRQLIAARDLCPLLVLPQALLAGHAVDAQSGFRMTKSDASTEYWRRALRLAPYDAELHYQFGRWELEAGRFDTAYSAWQQALQRSPRRVNEIVDRALPKLGAEQLMLKILPDDPVYLIGAAQLIANDPKRADDPQFQTDQRRLVQRAREKLMTIVERSPEDCYNLAVAHRMLGELPQALALFQEALDRQPSAINWHYEYAEALYATGERKNKMIAQQHLNFVLREMPHHGPAHNLKATVDKELAPVKRDAELPR